jgi:hypothetical protein
MLEIELREFVKVCDRKDVWMRECVRDVKV